MKTRLIVLTILLPVAAFAQVTNFHCWASYGQTNVASLNGFSLSSLPIDISCSCLIDGQISFYTNFPSVIGDPIGRLTNAQLSVGITNNLVTTNGTFSGTILGGILTNSTIYIGPGIKLSAVTNNVRVTPAGSGSNHQYFVVNPN
jgi:hypothetical protein